MRRPAHKYTTLEDLRADRDSVAWYWRLIALVASWMILCGYLLLPAAFTSDYNLKFNRSVLTIIIVTLMTTGYSFTGLLCFACTSWYFQADSIFLPALSSSALGLITILATLAASNRHHMLPAAVIGIVLSCSSALTYGGLLLWTYRKIAVLQKAATRAPAGYSDNSYYKNFIANMYPSVMNHADHVPLTDEERINQQMAMLLMKADPGPSPDASQGTFKINLPDEPEHEMATEVQRDPIYIPPNSAVPTPVMTTPPRPRSLSEYYNNNNNNNNHASRGRTENMNDQLRQQQRSVWEQSNPRKSRAGSELTVEEAMRGRSLGRESGERSRAVSREERRREIEMGSFQSSTSR